jgi:hypothetical protein
MEFRLFLLAYVGHFLLVLALYVALTVVRMRDVKAGETNISDYVREDGDTPTAARIRRNIANQFEMPIFATFAAAVLVVMGAVGWFDVASAWLLFAGRLIHTLVQTMTGNVALRGQVYVVTVIATSLLMGHVAWIALGLDQP